MNAMTIVGLIVALFFAVAMAIRGLTGLQMQCAWEFLSPEKRDDTPRS